MAIGLAARIKTFIAGDKLSAGTHVNPLQDAIVSLTAGYGSDHDTDDEDSCHDRVRFTDPSDVQIVRNAKDDNEILVRNRDTLKTSVTGPEIVGQRLTVLPNTREDTFRLGRTVKAEAFAFLRDQQFEERLPVASGVDAALTPTSWELSINGKLACAPVGGANASAAFPLPVNAGHELDSITMVVDYTVDTGSIGTLELLIVDTSGASAEFLSNTSEVIDNDLGGAHLSGTATLTITPGAGVVVGSSASEFQAFLEAKATSLNGFTALSVRSLSRTWTVPADTVIVPQ